MITSSKEFFSEIDKLECNLSENNYGGLAEKLGKAKFASGILSEIFGEVESVLNEISISIPEPNPYILQIAKLKKAINKYKK